ncbi:MAG: hypothetical protein FJ279_38470 [Planctomycetes bacterium]|nr:hypothetical protein [Planctomycetota bacterium]
MSVTEKRPESPKAETRATSVSGYEAPAEALRLVTTFYSFKGGVGRSQALCAAGYVLARQRRKALLVDVDLEAPGLSIALLDEEARQARQGFVEIATDLSTQILNAVTDQKPLPENLVSQVASWISDSLQVLPENAYLGLDEKERTFVTFRGS